jgi:hypothetical protein
MKKLLLIFSGFFVSSSICLAEIPKINPNIPIPKQQTDFQAIMNKMPVVPQALVGKREGEPYLEQVEKFKSEWNFEIGRSKKKGAVPKITEIKDWICMTNGAGDGKAKTVSINCYPAGMVRAHLFLRVKNPTTEKLYRGDVLKVSGTVSRLSVSNPVSDINYDMEIKNATYELIEKAK